MTLRQLPDAERQEIEKQLVTFDDLDGNFSAFSVYRGDAEGDAFSEPEPGKRHLVAHPRIIFEALPWSLDYGGLIVKWPATYPMYVYVHNMPVADAPVLLARFPWFYQQNPSATLLKFLGWGTLDPVKVKSWLLSSLRCWRSTRRLSVEATTAMLALCQCSDGLLSNMALSKGTYHTGFWMKKNPVLKGHTTYDISIEILGTVVSMGENSNSWGYNAWGCCARLVVF